MKDSLTTYIERNRLAVMRLIQCAANKINESKNNACAEEKQVQTVMTAIVLLKTIKRVKYNDCYAFLKKKYSDSTLLKLLKTQDEYAEEMKIETYEKEHKVIIDLLSMEVQYQKSVYSAFDTFLCDYISTIERKIECLVNHNTNHFDVDTLRNYMMDQILYICWLKDFIEKYYSAESIIVADLKPIRNEYQKTIFV